MRMTEEMSTIAAFLIDQSLAKIITEHHLDTEFLIEFIFSNPLFPAKNKELLKHGIELYFASDYIAAIHVLSTQIEALARAFIQASNGIVYIWNRDQGSPDYKGLGRLLAEARASGIFNERFSMYLQIVLTDSRGLNIRNDTCHGIAHEEFFCKTVADRLMHVVLLFSIFSQKEPQVKANAE